MPASSTTPTRRVQPWRTLHLSPILPVVRCSCLVCCFPGCRVANLVVRGWIGHMHSFRSSDIQGRNPTSIHHRDHGSAHDVVQAHGRDAEGSNEGCADEKACQGRRKSRRWGWKRNGEAGSKHAWLESPLGRVRKATPRLRNRCQKHQRRRNWTLRGGWRR